MEKAVRNRTRFGSLGNLLRETPLVRTPVMWCRSIGCHPERSTGWLITIMYHGMTASDRPRFIDQLSFMKSLGDFVSPSEAVALLEPGNRLTGRHFCISFDDGQRNAYRYAIPILTELSIPSVFFVVPTWISAAPDAADRKYISWDECRYMARAGVTIGSHSLSHRRFSTLDDLQAITELSVSKSRIEHEVGQCCEHFACPWGQPRDDYLPARDPRLAAAAGYHSFFTTIRGSATSDTSRWAIPRVRLEPGWGLAQLRYLFTR